MNTPRTNEALETELSEMRQAMSRVAANLGNGSFATVDASHEWMTREVPEEVRIYCERLRRELSIAKKLLQDERFHFADLLKQRVIACEKVEKLREYASECVRMLNLDDNDSYAADDREGAIDTAHGVLTKALEETK